MMFKTSEAIIHCPIRMKKYLVNFNVYPIDTTATVIDAIMVVGVESGPFHICLTARIPYFFKSLPTGIRYPHQRSLTPRWGCLSIVFTLICSSWRKMYCRVVSLS